MNHLPRLRKTPAPLSGSKLPGHGIPFAIASKFFFVPGDARNWWLRDIGDSWVTSPDTTISMLGVSKLLSPKKVASDCGDSKIMLKKAWLAMVRLTTPGKTGGKRWCTAIVLIAVCALTVSVTTRYSYSPGPAKGHVVQRHHSLTPGLQRLLNNAATWIPPVVEAAIFHELEQHSHVAPSDCPVSSALLERQLYNRPPPFEFSLS